LGSTFLGSVALPSKRARQIADFWIFLYQVGLKIMARTLQEFYGYL